MAAALGLSGIGWALSLIEPFNRALCAGLLRYYWFRLADVMVPLGVALTGTALLAWALRRRPRLGRRWLAVAVLVAAVHLAPEAAGRLSPSVPPADRMPNYPAWRDVCNWIVASGQIPADARFLTPRANQTFKWYTGRPEVVTWKEIPQDAEAIVAWWQRLRSIYAVSPGEPASGWVKSLAALGTDGVRKAARDYDAQYVLTKADLPLELPVVYKNEYYVIYRVDDGVK